MDISEAMMWGQQAVMTVALISGPVLLAALVVGAVISILQAITQVHEMTLVFVPKIAVVFIIMTMMAGWMLDRAVFFGEMCFRATAETER